MSVEREGSLNGIGDLVQQLIDGGTPPAVAATVVAEAFARGAAACKSTGNPVDRAAEKRRAWDRERKAVQRGAEQKSGGSPVEVHPNSANQLSLSNSEIQKKERASGKICPPEFHPTEKHYEAALKLGVGRPRVDELCEDMRSWSRANSNRAVARKSDWGLALHQWIKRFAAEARPNGHKGASGGWA